MEGKERETNPTKTPKGEGYTVRVDGKKKLTTAVLEKQLNQAQAKLRCAAFATAAAFLVT